MTGDTIRQWRERHGISREVLARRLGMSPRSISRWENEGKELSALAAAAMRRVMTAARRKAVAR